MMDDQTPVMSIESDGAREWRLNGYLHRTDGPAVEWTNGTCEWYVHGQRHRTDGPALEWADGGRDWYVNGRELTFNEWVSRVAATEEQRMALIMCWG